MKERAFDEVAERARRGRDRRHLSRGHAHRDRRAESRSVRASQQIVAGDAGAGGADGAARPVGQLLHAARTRGKAMRRWRGMFPRIALVVAPPVAPAEATPERALREGARAARRRALRTQERSSKGRRHADHRVDSGRSRRIRGSTTRSSRRSPARFIGLIAGLIVKQWRTARRRRPRARRRQRCRPRALRPPAMPDARLDTIEARLARLEAALERAGIALVPVGRCRCRRRRSSRLPLPLRRPPHRSRLRRRRASSRSTPTAPSRRPLTADIGAGARRGSADPGLQRPRACAAQRRLGLDHRRQHARSRRHPGAVHRRRLPAQVRVRAHDRSDRAAARRRSRSAASRCSCSAGACASGANGYAMILQGGGVGVLYLTVFAALKLYALLPPLAAFALLFLDRRAVELARGAPGFDRARRGRRDRRLPGAGAHVDRRGQPRAAVLLLRAAERGHLRDRVVQGLAPAEPPRLRLHLRHRHAVGRSRATAPRTSRRPSRSWCCSSCSTSAIAVLYALRRSVEVRNYVDGTLVFGTPLVAAGLAARAGARFRVRDGVLSASPPRRSTSCWRGGCGRAAATTCACWSNRFSRWASRSPRSPCRSRSTRAGPRRPGRSKARRSYGSARASSAWQRASSGSCCNWRRPCRSGLAGCRGADERRRGRCRSSTASASAPC